MNNDAFQKLVRERAHVKSTKEIAREAVEAEFHRRGRGKRQRTSDSDSDNDADAPRRKNHSNRSKLNEEQKGENDNVLEELAGKYRDRAKERREGTSGGRQVLSAEQLLEADDPAALVKSLDDESRAQFVKGLDVSLARSNKERIGNTDLTTDHAKDSLDTSNKFPSADVAQAWILSTTDDATTTSLGRDMLTYLKSMHREVEIPMEPTSAGLSIQRSSLTFSLDGDPKNADRAWECPKQQTFARVGESLFIKATPITDDILVRMENASRRAKKATSASFSNKKSDAQQDSTSFSEYYGNDTDNSDDDIFGDLEGEYDPIAEQKTGTSEQKAQLAEGDPDGNDEREMNTNAVPRVSFFELGESRASASGIIEEGTLKKEGYTGLRELGGSTSQRTRLVGLSSTTGYDDDIDTDFNGMLEYKDEEGCLSKKKKKHADEKTDDGKEDGLGQH
ncbi:predicted protein [Phaeodactylum tricornutum CCAP 1055/1]|uniref:RED-like N-terminal domain-containing protein n=1 Tax=Phaeodactylum tricornutum (strain CCAP 1055/1) TaxID=556484 RepID=B7FVM1_PHATC|nr:predicted protein [Phaeodactylum tricornutum CCAP 1055/1]EEC49427.1 predicted protein [Phaeodactylum tricornutum CCAP 1055/1]|eukprot:XP_002178729.1 predicted protein [Phaeodactylum tricornutum CCAP 1055/1]